VFLQPLHHSLGYLNDPFGIPNPTPNYIGDPQSPFPWLNWNNRPYVSPLELMLVPWLSSSRLLNYNGGYNIVPGGNPYTTPGAPFPHLANMFLSGSAAAPNEELHQILEYLGMPSPFVGTETWINPMLASGTASLTSPFLPPFNRISNYREPGRINLNTIYSQEVFNGLMAGCPNAQPAWTDFVKSRSGGTSTNILDMPDSIFPTEFAQPFRSFTGANLMPTGVSALKFNNEIDATLLREKSSVSIVTSSTPHQITRTGLGVPLFNYTSANACNNTDRNPYFHYQGLERLGNLVTTRSNVYAVWITVGYFEVEPAAQMIARLYPNWTSQQVQNQLANYPDGYTLGRELGIDTGEIKRHRAFFIFDRTIPVGFQRGSDLNFEKAILVKRFIE
jgi:hypothetical protein